MRAALVLRLAIPRGRNLLQTRNYLNSADSLFPDCVCSLAFRALQCQWQTGDPLAHNGSTSECVSFLYQGVTALFR